VVSEPWWPSGHEFKSHHLYLFDKNKTCGSAQVSSPKGFHLRGYVRE
jgi:hypothetical protein